MVPSSAKLGQIIVITGFTNDVFTGTPRHIAGKYVALNVEFSHAVGVIGPGPDQACSQSHDDAPHTPAQLAGHHLRSKGLSGGAVLDMLCGVVGIFHVRGCKSSGYASLRPVDAYIAASQR